MSKKQVRFSSKTTINNEFNDKPMTPEVNTGQNVADNEKFQSDEDAVDSMWEKLVLYYLSRLKGLCDWRSYSWTAQGNRCTCKSKSRESIASSFSDHLEDQIIKKVTEEALQGTKPNYTRNLAEISTYMAAGYEEGKQQAAKIVIRALKFGLLTGILEKNGSFYRIRSKYLDKQEKLPHCKLYKKSCKTKKNTKCGRGKKQTLASTTLRNGKKFYKNTKVVKKNAKAKKSYRDGTACSKDEKSLQKFVRSISPLLSSSRSSSPKSTKSEDSGKAGPSAKRKHSRVIIKKPVFPKPSCKKRSRSQTKSPTPSKSRSVTSVHQYKPRRLKYRRYHTPESRRCSSVLSSMSSSSAMSICTVCRRKRNRSNSNDSKASGNAKKLKERSTHEL